MPTGLIVSLGLVLVLGLWAIVATFTAVMRGSHNREDRDVATSCLEELIRYTDALDPWAGEKARQIAARYDSGLLTVAARPVPRRGEQVEQVRSRAPREIGGYRDRPARDDNTEGERWLHR